MAGRGRSQRAAPAARWAGVFCPATSRCAAGRTRRRPTARPSQAGKEPRSGPAWIGRSRLGRYADTGTSVPCGRPVGPDPSAARVAAPSRLVHEKFHAESERIDHRGSEPRGPPATFAVPLGWCRALAWPEFRCLFDRPSRCAVDDALLRVPGTAAFDFAACASRPRPHPLFGTTGLSGGSSLPARG